MWFCTECCTFCTVRCNVVCRLYELMYRVVYSLYVVVLSCMLIANTVILCACRIQHHEQFYMYIVMCTMSNVQYHVYSITYYNVIYCIMSVHCCVCNDMCTVSCKQCRVMFMTCLHYTVSWFEHWDLTEVCVLCLTETVCGLYDHLKVVPTEGLLGWCSS